MKKDRTLTSAIFDSKLIDDGYEWKKAENEKIGDWTKIYSFDDKRMEASRVVAFLIPSLLGKDCTSECKVRSRRLAEKMIHFEDLLYTTRGGIAKKFYRDHLNHMLRVAILGRVLAKKIVCLNFSEEEIRMFTLAALVHDIAYPLAEAFNMIADMASAMEECYSSLKFTKGEPIFNIKILLELFNSLRNSSKNLSAADLADSLRNHNHGIMGALEFLSYVKDRQKYSSVIEAIAFHDTDLTHRVKLVDKKILAVLILSDEMQDWGRPACFEQEPVIAEIEKFAIEENKVQGCFDLSKDQSVSPFRQIHAKLKNISRIETNQTNFSVQLSFLLPKYSTFNYAMFEELLQVVYDSHPNMMTLPAGISSDIFLENYYGARLTDEEKHEIVKALSQKKELSSLSLFSNAPLYLDEVRMEALYISKDLGDLKEATIRNEKGIFNLEIKGEKGKKSGFLKAQDEGPGLGLCKRIVGELLVFHSILADIRKLKLVPLSFYLTPTDMKKTLESAEIAFQEEIVDNIASIHRCLQNRGFFSLSDGLERKGD